MTVDQLMTEGMITVGPENWLDQNGRLDGRFK
jgi:hypothetical protein